MWGRRARLNLNRNCAGARVAWLAAVRVVAEATGVAADDIAAAQRRGRPARPRNNPVSFARQAAIYLAVTGGDVRQGALARALGVSRYHVHKSCRTLEERRDDPAIDALLAAMEARL